MLTTSGMRQLKKWCASSKRTSCPLQKKMKPCGQYTVETYLEHYFFIFCCYDLGRTVEEFPGKWKKRWLVGPSLAKERNGAENQNRNQDFSQNQILPQQMPRQNHRQNQGVLEDQILPQQKPQTNPRFFRRSNFATAKTTAKTTDKTKVFRRSNFATAKTTAKTTDKTKVFRRSNLATAKTAAKTTDKTKVF